ncbi:MAG: 3-methyl-2-oxobutanoate dehydrogenase subunit beta [Acidobacteriota bacterium]|nr:MAG: 3-methyl-2-oxobutanoate dehydrogenase subunit beta [Acidobacteriota bacterium]
MKSPASMLPAEEYITSGHLGCQGCGAALAMRYVLKALGEKTIVVMPACCWSVIAGPHPFSALKVPLLHTAFETAAATASGVRAALDLQGDRETEVVAWAGDGGTFDIGLQALSGAAERNEDILYVCYDNEAYMNTGIQRSSATPWGAWTTTTPSAKMEVKKDIIQIMAAHAIPYAATASVAYPDDLYNKSLKAKRIQGTRFLHILSPCPPGWKISSELSVRFARLAVLSRVFPLFEVENGSSYRLHEITDPVSVEAYVQAQGRFQNLDRKAIQQFQENVDARWTKLQRLSEHREGDPAQSYAAAPR